MGAYNKEKEKLFTWADSNRKRGNGFKLKEESCILDFRKQNFTLRMVRHWNRITRVEDAASLEEFRAGGNSEQHDLGEGEPAYGRVAGTR